MRACACAVILSLWLIPVAWAGEVILTMPDAQLRGAITEVCIWHSCESPQHGGYKTDQEKLTWVMNRLIQIVSMNHYQGLEDIGGTLEIRYDQSRELVVP